MTSDELEFSISRYLDGTLPPLEKAALEERLATDAVARELLAEYRKLDSVIRAGARADAPPALDWGKLASRISDSLGDIETPGVHYSLARFHTVARVAVAAVVALGMGVAVYLMRPSDPTVAPGPTSVAVLQVSGPKVEASDQPALAQVSIGPANEVAGWRYNETVVYRPPRVVIASAYEPVQDNSQPY